MSRGRKRALATAAAILVLCVGAAGCGEEEETEVVEGEPVVLGDLHFNVQLTRFLNPSDREDGEYLEGQEVPPPPGQAYLAVFMEVENEGDEAAELPTRSEMDVVDTTHAVYKPLASDSVFALPLGRTVPAGAEIPLPDTAAASGPIQGSMVLFLVDLSVSENRPLELEIKGDGEEGRVELDI
jgi:hypothetical protein